jgi:hypothetical protein
VRGTSRTDPGPAHGTSSEGPRTDGAHTAYSHTGQGTRGGNPGARNANRSPAKGGKAKNAHPNAGKANAKAPYRDGHVVLVVAPCDR